MTTHKPWWEQADEDLGAAHRELDEKYDELQAAGVVILVVEKDERGHVRNVSCRAKKGLGITSIMSEPPRRRG